MKIIKMTEGQPFDMGKGDTRNVIGVHTGAKHMTFNYAKFEPGQAFKQHIHPHSEDTILVLEGDGVIKLDDEEYPIEAGDVIHVSAGEYHGTVAGPNGMVAVSCQAPIDKALFAGGTQPGEAEGERIDVTAPENQRISDYLLTRTRTVRKRLDFSRPIEDEIIAKCLEIAMQAPTASNSQGWHFVVITDDEKKAAIAEYYRKSFMAYRGTREEPMNEPTGEGDYADQMRRVVDSSRYLAENIHRVPVMVIPCIEGRVEDQGQAAQASRYGSILPAAWSLMMALRSRGIGAAWTTLHLRYEKEVGEILGIPDTMTQAVLLPVAYYKGDDFKPAKRLAPRERIYWNGWEG